MGGSTAKRKPVTPPTVRTDRDRIMILLGIGLIVLLLVTVYVSMFNGGSRPGRKIRGPVRNPDVSSVTIPVLPTGRVMGREGMSTRSGGNLTTSDFR
ncbi:MAG: hypothetical protein P8182_12170 [Deltaproteobacteria bacterium]